MIIKGSPHHLIIIIKREYLCSPYTSATAFRIKLHQKLISISEREILQGISRKVQTRKFASQSWCTIEVVRRHYDRSEIKYPTEGKSY